MSVFRASRHVVLAAFAAALASSAAAQSFPVKLSGFSGQQLKGGPVAIPSYQVSYFTQHQGTASGGVMTKARLTTTLAGVDEATMRELADEAYADLKAQLQAAGVPLVPEADVRATLASAGVTLAPNNADITRIGAGITIGADVKKSHAAFGAQAAPIISGLHTTSTNGMQIAGTIGSLNRLGPVAKSHKAILIMPHVALDFASTSAKAGSDFLGRASAGASSRMVFTLSAVSQASLLSASADGRFTTPGGMRMTKDLTSAVPFGTVATGEGAVRALSVSSVTDSNYIVRDTARGDAAVVDKAAWVPLVRDAYKSFNAAIVAEIRKARGL